MSLRGEALSATGPRTTPSGGGAILPSSSPVLADWNDRGAASFRGSQCGSDGCRRCRPRSRCRSAHWLGKGPAGEAMRGKETIRGIVFRSMGCRPRRSRCIPPRDVAGGSIHRQMNLAVSAPAMGSPACAPAISFGQLTRGTAATVSRHSPRNLTWCRQPAGSAALLNGASGPACTGRSPPGGMAIILLTPDGT